MDQITSRQNETVRECGKLLHSAAARREQGRFLCEGARLCRDAAKSGAEIELFFVTDSALEKYGDYCREIEEKASRSFRISDHIAPLLSDTKNPQGVYCVCRQPSLPTDLSTLDLSGSYLALEHLQDPTNLGTVLRTAEALGVGGVLLCGSCCDPFGPKVVRGSMGAVFRLPLYRCDDSPAAMAALKGLGFFTVASVVDRDAQPITSVDFSRPTVMAIGNEGSGLSAETVAACDRQVTIPMLGRAESLNASAASSILLWEMMRQAGAGRSQG